jgi:predicted DNA repair protein MutK
MLLVGGGIYIHNIEPLHHLFAHWPMLSGELVVGLLVGMIVLGVEKGVHRVMR